MRRIAFLKLIEQGSTVLAHTALRRAVALVGRENVYWCVFDENREIIDILDVIPPENVLAIRTNSIARLLFDTIRCLLRMRQLRIDATVDLEFFARAPAILAYLSGARVRVGVHRFQSEAPYRGDLMTHRVQYNAYLHTAVSFDLLAQALSADPAELPMPKLPPSVIEPLPRLRVEQQERDAVLALLKSEGHCGDGGRLLLLNPNAHDRLPLRKWPMERFVEIGIRALADFPDVTLVVTGTAAERPEAERLRKSIGSPRVLNLAGHTTLRQAIVLYGMAAAVLTNDSGPAHFATLTGTHVVALFGPETPQLYGPLGANAHALWAGIACSPCVNALNHRISPCTDNVCMQRLSVDLVYGRVRECLELTAPRASGDADPDCRSRRSPS